MIFLFNLPRSCNDSSRFQGTGVSRSTIRSSPLCPGCCLVQKQGSPLARSRARPVPSRSQHAFACSVWPSARRSLNPTNTRAASRAARDFRIPKPTPFRTLWFWSPRRFFAKARAVRSTSWIGGWTPCCNLPSRKSPFRRTNTGDHPLSGDGARQHLDLVCGESRANRA
jgi:hypothetical protein